MSRKNSVILGLGSNLGSKSANLCAAIKYISDFCEVVKVSPVYKTESLLKDDQDSYFNLCVLALTSLEPQDLLHNIKNIEKKMGRENTGIWYTRVIDIDIIDFNNGIFNSDRLIIPHPQIGLRSFVLYPLLDVKPDFIHPVSCLSGENMVKIIKDDLGIKKGWGIDMAVITISRQYGCGGEYVAERASEILNFRLFNKELVKFAAILTGTDEEKLKLYDEEQHSTFRSFMSKYFDTDMFSDLFKQTDYSPKTLRQIMSQEHEAFFDVYSTGESIADAESFHGMLKRIINKAAEEMNAVILGRGGVCILEDNPTALHFRLVATMDDRVKWVSMREELSAKEAYEKIKDTDNRKRKYFKHYFDRSIDDHWMYHSILNLSKLDLTEATHAIVDIAKTKFKI